MPGTMEEHNILALCLSHGVVDASNMLPANREAFYNNESQADMKWLTGVPELHVSRKSDASHELKHKAGAVQIHCPLVPAAKSNKRITCMLATTSCPKGYYMNPNEHV